MAARLVAALAVVAVVLAEHFPHGSNTAARGHQTVHVNRAPASAPAVLTQRGPVGRPTHSTVRRPVPHPFGSPHPTNGQYPTRPTYRPHPTYTPTTPAYGPQPHGPAPAPSYGSDQPACAATSDKPWCLEDRDYPTYEIQAAAEHNADKLLSLYADVADLSTKLSVDLNSYKAETYLCPSETSYVRPLRAVNTDGQWRVIVNGIKVHYDTLTQTVRLEDCLTIDEPCPLLPQCYDSKCLQKYIYHRFLVYNPYDKYFPFAVETFKLPASCACLLRESVFEH